MRALEAFAFLNWLLRMSTPSLLAIPILMLHCSDVLLYHSASPRFRRPLQGAQRCLEVASQRIRLERPEKNRRRRTCIRTTTDPSYGTSMNLIITVLIIMKI